MDWERGDYNDVLFFDSENKINKALPEGAVSLGSKPVPSGYKEVKGPKGGRYAVPKGDESKQEDSEVYDSPEKLKELASKLYNDIPEEERKQIEEAVSNWKSGNDTQGKHKKDGVYTEERRSLHKEKILSPYSKAMDDLANQEEKRVVFMSGLPASGKTTATKRMFKKVGDNPEILEDNSGHKYVVLNADDIKGLLPEYNGLNAAEVHEESSDLNKMLIAMAQDKGASVVIDGTLANPEKAKKIHENFKGLGYKGSLINVKVKTENSLKRAKSRYDRSKRFVPFDVIAGMSEGIIKTIEELKESFESYTSIDNNGAEPVYE